MAQVRPPFWGGRHRRCRVMVPVHGSGHEDQGDQEAHSPSTVRRGCHELGVAAQWPPSPPSFRPRQAHCPPRCPGPSPGQAAAKQAWVWRLGPGQSCSTVSLGGEQRRLRACTPGPHVRLQGSHGLQGPQAPQPCSSGEAPASPARSQSGCPSHTWGGVGQSSLLAGWHGGFACRTPHPPTLTSWKPMQRP